MKSILHSSKWAIACAMIVSPFFAGCGEEPVKEGIDESKATEVVVDQEEVQKASKSVGVID